MSSTPETIVHIPLEQLRPGPGNLRGETWPEPDPELAASIKSVGIIEPLIVVRGDAGYLVVAGHRRTSAAILSKLPTVPAIVRELDEKAALTQALIENLQREDLPPLDEARGLQRLIAFGLTQKDLAAKIGRSQSHISKRLALLTLPESARKAIVGGSLHLEDALDLVGYSPTVVERVVKNLGGTRWAGDVQRWARSFRDEETRNAKRAAGLAELQKAKVSVLKTSQYGQPAGRGWVELGKGHGKLGIAVGVHAKQPCHAAYVDGDGGIRYVCTKPANHPRELKASAPAAARELRAAQEKRLAGAATRSRNAVLRKRQVIRGSELERLITAKQPKDAIVDFVLRQLLQVVLGQPGSLGEIAAAALKIPTPKGGRDSGEWARYIAGGQASERLLRVAYAWALASGEAPYRMLVERNYFIPDLRANAARYMAHLHGAGYKPDPAELEALKPAQGYLAGPPAFDVAPKAKAAKARKRK